MKALLPVTCTERTSSASAMQQIWEKDDGQEMQNVVISFDVLQNMRFRGSRSFMKIDSNTPLERKSMLGRRCASKLIPQGKAAAQVRVKTQLILVISAATVSEISAYSIVPHWI